jgi:hypothetical protein
VPVSTSPNRDQVARWLCSPRVVDSRGRILSWHNPDHPGYPYPEAAGLWLSWAAWRRETGQDGPDDDRVRRVANPLREELDRRGGVGRGDHLYLLDTCVALDGMARVTASHDIRPCDTGRSVPLLARFVGEETPIWPPAPEEGRWSSSWGTHHLRSAGLLRRAASVLVDGELADLAGAIRALATRDTGASPDYVHARAYAVEGELLLAAYPGPPGGVDVLGELAGLAGLQADDGHLPAWSDGSGGARGDATAQVARLWALVDREEFTDPLQRALAFLAARQDTAGGIPYDAARGDRNTWAAVFTDQAACWAAHESAPPGPEALV